MLDKYILGTLGNKALAEKALRNFGSARSTGEAARADAAARRRKLVLFLPALVLAAFHAVALLANVAFLLLVHALRVSPDVIARHRAQWDALARHWARYPSCFVYKAVECALYAERCPQDVTNALEVGVYTGETARGFFLGRELAAGVEYNIERFLAYKAGGTLHRHLYAADVRRLPFADGCFDDVYCIHSIDDMELPAREALAEMGRVVRPGGSVCFSGVSLNFTRHNLLVLLLGKLGFRRAAETVFRYVYIGSFNHHDRAGWTEELARSGLALEHYETYVPFRIAGLFDLAYRPETVLINLCGWRDWLTPIASTRLFRAVLYRATAAMLHLSRRWTGDGQEGINFFIVARRPGERTGDHRFDPVADVRCIRCGAPGSGFQPWAPTGITHTTCGGCGHRFVVVEGIPAFLEPEGSAA